MCVVELGCKAYISSYVVKEEYIDPDINTTYAHLSIIFVNILLILWSPHRFQDIYFNLSYNLTEFQSGLKCSRVSFAFS